MEVQDQFSRRAILFLRQPPPVARFGAVTRGKALAHVRWQLRIPLVGLHGVSTLSRCDEAPTGVYGLAKKTNAQCRHEARYSRAHRRKSRQAWRCG